MLTRHVALVSEESSISMLELSKVAAAFQKQVTRDLTPLWKIEADVGGFERLEDVPLDYWPVVVKDDIGDPEAAGYHEDENGQPFALVQYDEGWTLTASHEVLEMLCDPFGRRLVAGQSPISKQGRVKFLVEVCDPSEAAEYSYTVNGVQVSDFYTPNYFDPVASSAVRYSYRGVIKKPREVLKGGYLSWYDPETRAWWQRTWFEGSKPADHKLAALKIENGNIRQALDRVTAKKSMAAMRRNGKPLRGGRRRGMMEAAMSTVDNGFVHRAVDLRASIRKAIESGRSAKG